MRFVLYGFGAVTFAVMTVRAAVILTAEPGPGGRLGLWADAVLGYVVPVGVWAAAAILGELQSLRAELERHRQPPQPPDA